MDPAPLPGRLRAILARGPVIPILTLHDAAVAAPLAEALFAGGIGVFEVVLRTPAACDAVAAMRAAVPAADVGMGTLLAPDDVARAVAAGATFGVAPGLTGALAAAAAAHRLPFLPGVATPGEIMAAREAGFRELKYFPAGGTAGIAFLKAMAPVFPDVVFCPTGGIGPGDVAAYRSLPNCPVVGGSWIVPTGLLERRDWGAITALARQAAASA